MEENEVLVSTILSNLISFTHMHGFSVSDELNNQIEGCFETIVRITGHEKGRLINNTITTAVKVNDMIDAIMYLYDNSLIIKDESTPSISSVYKMIGIIIKSAIDDSRKIKKT